MRLMLIGLTGSMGVGKSTALELIKEAFPNEDIKLIKFAETLYQIQEDIYGRISSVYKRPDNFVKDRKLLQWIGSDWARNTIRDTIWVDIWKSKTFDALSKKSIVVVDDCRFDNEAQAIKDMGGVIIKIIADNSISRIPTAQGIPGHESELGVDKKFIDYVIENNDTLESYKHKLSVLYSKLAG